MRYEMIIPIQKRFVARLILATTIMIGWSISGAAQSPTPPPPYGPAHVGGYDPITEEFNRRQPRTFFPRRTYGPAKEARVVKNGLLAPSLHDRADHAAFLKQSDTGLVKLLPREVYDWRTYGTEKHLKLPGGGAYYSFFYLLHEYGYGSDIELDHNKFTVGFAGVDYGVMVNLGDVPLNDVSATDARAAFLASYRHARNEPDARCEFKRFRDGLTINGLQHKRSLPVQVGSTYLLRSMNYGRSDLLVAFRVVRQEPDGSTIIAWKLLKEFRRPGFDRVLYVDSVDSPDKCPIK
jgi:hypothetical protein